ncbi:MAG: threonylcarbamoyl-AMP synthase [Bradyrhizobiaceae bacterium]|nr:threonylcarbamoyl-AMP synthase [Hyphomicrobiales bacterium]MBV9426606.1 threonylcarbamoyl-AMP synthase [Bradyrhizobiaceae bacterium]
MTVEIATRTMHADAKAIAEAARILRAGGLVAFPTETVYGLGADGTNAAAVARLYAAKGRPKFNPLIVHVADPAMAQGLAKFDAAASTLAAAFWPGPLTLVLPKTDDCPVAEIATAGLDTIAVRVPDHPVAHALIEAAGRPLVAPSANRSGHVSPTAAAHVAADLGRRIDLILDAGPTRVGVESTIVSCLSDDPVLLRPGGVARAAIEDVLPAPLGEPASAQANGPQAPGMLPSHYAPITRLRLGATRVEPHEALLAFGPTVPPGAAQAVAVLNLSPSADLVEAAANLFAHLRALDRAGARAIAAMPVPRDGLGEAINDRLARAATPR